MATSTINNDKQFSLTEVMVARLNLIWQMGEVSLSATGNELRIPLQIGKQLQAFEIEELEKRLSRKFNDAPTWHFEDLKLEALRICALPSSPAITYNSETPVSSPSTSSPVAVSAEVGESAADASHDAGSKRHKVPRPPNAFILYRQKWHPKIKAQNPTIHNNDISVLLGKQWKAEPPTVKQEFKDMAERIKTQHAAENPGYQYAPRKSSDKKRRMTARKLARLQENTLRSSAGVAATANGMLNDVQSEYADLPIKANNVLTAQAPLPTLEELLGISSNNYHGNSPAIDESGLHFTLPFTSLPASSNTDLDNIDQYVEHADLNIPAELSASTPDHVDATEDFLNSIMDLEAFAGVRWFDGASLSSMTEIDEIDDQLPHLAPLDPAEHSGHQTESASILDLFP